MSLKKEIGDSNQVKERLDELARTAEKESRAVIVIGDLKGFVDLGDDLVNCLVSEMTRVFESCRENLWVMGWPATYETYMKFLSRFPMLDKDWDLQLQLITSARPPTGATGGVIIRPLRFVCGCISLNLSILLCA